MAGVLAGLRQPFRHAGGRLGVGMGGWAKIRTTPFSVIGQVAQPWSNSLSSQRLAHGCSTCP
jgi:hypothetical protein